MGTKGAPRPIPTPKGLPKVEGCNCKQVGGVIVVTPSKLRSALAMDHIRSAVRRAIPGSQVLVVPHGWDVCTVRASDLRALRDSTDKVLEHVQQ